MTVRYITLALLLTVACGNEPPSVDAWAEQRWEPMVEAVPVPEEASPPNCENGLEQLRELAVGLDPAPSDELRDAAHGWLHAAEALMFACTSEPDLDYAARYERLLLRQAEVEAVLDRS